MKKLISQYQFGLLPEDQKEKAEAHLLECEACLRELYQMDPALEMLEGNPERFLDILKKKKNKEPVIKNALNRARRRIQLFLAVWKRHRITGIVTPAAAIIALVLYIQLTAPRQYADLAIIQKSRYEMLHFKSPENLTPDQKALKDALELYEKDLYTEAIAQFKNIIDREPDNAYARFYLGVSLLLTHDLNGARTQFTRAVQFSRYMEDSLLLEKCYWYVGNIYLLNNNADNARQIFQILAAMNGPFRQKAEKQISRMNKLKKRIGE